ncbi:MAG: hypothetical protein WCH65_06330 [bacterium]
MVPIKPNFEELKINDSQQAKLLISTLDKEEKKLLLEALNEESLERQIEKDTEIFEKQTEKLVVGYLKGKKGNVFSRLDNAPEYSFFRLFNVKDDIGYFDFYGNGKEAITKRIFGNDNSGASKIVSGGEMSSKLGSIKTVKPGKIKCVDDEWQVIEPIEVSIE